MKLVKAAGGYKLVKDILDQFDSAIDWPKFKLDLATSIKKHDYILVDVAVDYLNVAIARDNVDEVREIFEKAFRNEFEKENREDWIARIIMALEGLKDIYDIDILAYHNQKVGLFPPPYFKVIYHISRSDLPVLILGETGTSKELMAKAVHQMSDRRTESFVEINCAAIPVNLLESELFGYERGAFTGADKQKIGRFQVAHRGTIFLDEIGKMPRELQAKLLKAIDDKQITRLGGNKPIRIDVRYIAAVQPINIDREQDRILPDLLYRLGYPRLFSMPTLNQRLESDPTRVIMNSLKVVSKKYNLNYKVSVSGQTIEVLSNHRYAGNYRELENILIQAIISAKSNNRSEIFPEDLKLDYGSINKPETVRASDRRDNMGDEDSQKDGGLGSLGGIKLKDIIEYANRVRASIVEKKMKEASDKGVGIKRVLLDEGLPKKSYQVFRKKVETITGKKFRDFKQQAISDFSRKSDHEKEVQDFRGKSAQQ
jgi:DNA-binding NtrC family response regulator